MSLMGGDVGVKGWGWGKARVERRGKEGGRVTRDEDILEILLGVISMSIYGGDVRVS